MKSALVLTSRVRSGGRCNMTREGGHHGASATTAVQSDTESRTLATVAPGRDAAGDWPGARLGHAVCALFRGGDRRRAAAAAAAVARGADRGRARRDFARLGVRALAARDWARVGACCFDGESRSTAARRPASVSRRRRGPPGVEPESAPQALSLGHVPGAGNYPPPGGPHRPMAYESGLPRSVI